jgi:solute carrier family 8 (sodium/calcium exchanger)
VFLGIGLAWLVATIYHWFKGTPGGFVVKAGSLAFSVTLFCSFALFAIALLLLRRTRWIGGELGGPKGYRIFTSSLFFGLWILYLILSGLESYCHIPGF